MSLLRVADTAGVSIATVSRVINNKPGISTDTRNMVFRTMEMMGYEPKPTSSRPGRKTIFDTDKALSNVVLLSFAKYNSQTNSPVYAEIIHGVEAELAANGMTMIFKHVSDESNVAEWVAQRDIDGVVLFAPSHTFVKSINRSNTKVPVVSILGDTQPFWCDRISYDKPAVAARAIDYLKGRGHREFLEIHNSNHSRRLAELADIYGMRIITLANDPNEVFISNEHENRANQVALDLKFEQYLSSNKLPKAIFLPCDAFAVPVYSILMRRGFVAGRDFEAVSVNNEKSLLDGLMPRPATVDIRSYDMGRAAVQRLLWRNGHPDEPRMTLTMDPLIVMPDVSVSGL